MTANCFIISCVAIVAILIQTCYGWLFYSPASRTQTIEDCKRLQTNNSPFYPSYCDRLLMSVLYPDGQTPSTSSRPSVTIGWGWTDWGPWQSDSCPDVCGRRCRRRIRACGGPYELSCAGRGKAEEFDDCPALNSATTGGGFQRLTTLPDTEESLSLLSNSNSHKNNDNNNNGFDHDVENNNLEGMGALFPMRDRTYRRKRLLQSRRRGSRRSNIN